MHPSDREIRIAAALILASGVAASGLAIFSEHLGLGADVARGTFGWKRISLLVAGGAAVTLGALLLARPRIGSRLVDWERIGPLERRIRIVGALAVAAGIAASGLTLLADDLGVGAAPGIFGWKRISLLVTGGAAVTLGALLLARPRIGSRLVDWERIGHYLRKLLFPSDRHLGYLAIGLLGLLGLVLVWTRLVRIDQSLWHDEVFTVLNYSGVGPGAILFGESDYQPNNHALYSLLSWFTVSLLGESEAMHRLWSVVPGIAAIGIGAWWAWRRIGRVAAVAFATIAVAGPLHLEWVPQARGYGLALLAATLTLIAADRLTRAYSRRMLLGFVAAGLLGIWTLFTFAIVFVGQAIALLRWRNLRVPVIFAMGAAGLLSVAFYAPVLGGVIASEAGGGSAGGASGEGWGRAIPLSAALLLDRPLEWLVIPTVTMLGVDGERGWLDGTGVAPGAPSATWVDVVVLAVFLLGLVALWRRGDGGLALILLVPPLFFNVAFSLGDQGTVTRHQLFLLPYLLIPVATGIAAVGRIAARYRLLKPVAIAVGVAAVLMLARAIVDWEEDRALPRESFRQVAEVVEWTGVDTVVTDSLRPDGLRFYLGESLIERSPTEVGALLCQRRREVVYIRHPAFSKPYPDPASLGCVMRKPSVRIRVPQRSRGSAIDVWIINPRASHETLRDDFG